MSDSNQIYVYDTDYSGSIDPNGQITEQWGESALSQSIKLWLASYKGDVVRDPQRGGYLTSLLSKPMTALEADDIRMTLRDGLEQDFEPALEVRRLIVTPNYERRYWQIYIEVYAPALKLTTTVDEKIKSKV